MTELIRPPLYDAYHHIETVTEEDGKRELYQVVGPVCESADFLGKNRWLPKPQEGSLLVVYDVGAYGYAMSSEYNMRPKPPEIIVDDGTVILTRKRGTFDSFYNAFTEEVIS
jgi:diaminopimelate decarboxylase